MAITKGSMGMVSLKISVLVIVMGAKVAYLVFLFIFFTAETQRRGGTPLRLRVSAVICIGCSFSNLHPDASGFKLVFSVSHKNKGTPSLRFLFLLFYFNPYKTFKAFMRSQWWRMASFARFKNSAPFSGSLFLMVVKRFSW